MRLKVFIMLVLSALIGWKACAQGLTNLGTITIHNALKWDSGETNLTGFKVYVSDASLTNFANFATVTTNLWRGDTTKQLNGQRAVYVTAVNAAGESEPSEKVLITFKAGVPLPPTHFQIYQVVTATASSSIPPMPPTPPTP